MGKIKYKAGDFVEFFGVIYKLIRPHGSFGWVGADANDTEKVILTEYFKTVKDSDKRS